MENKNTEQSHKYCSALAHKRKRLRLKWEYENIVKFLAARFKYAVLIADLIIMPQAQSLHEGFSQNNIGAALPLIIFLTC